MLRLFCLDQSNSSQAMKILIVAWMIFKILSIISYGMLMCINRYMLNMLLLSKYLPRSMVLLCGSFFFPLSLPFSFCVISYPKTIYLVTAEYLVSKDSVSNISEITSSGSPDNLTKVCFFRFSLCDIVCSCIILYMY